MDGTNVRNEIEKLIFQIFLGGSTISALEIRRQKEEELRKNDQYWQARLKKQEEDLKKTAAILEKEYNETVLIWL